MKHLEHFRSTPWVRKAFVVSLGGGCLAAGLVLLLMSHSSDRADELIGMPILVLLATVVSANIGSVLVWLNLQLQRGFQRVAVVLYPTMFVVGWVWSSRGDGAVAEHLSIALLFMFSTAACFIARRPSL
jgi:hypothetical protein